MKIYIVTQNFPPKNSGGIQTVMFSIATDISLMGYEVNVFPDHWYLGEDNFKVKEIFSHPKFLEQYINNFFKFRKQ